jgi:hypothetical protein
MMRPLATCVNSNGVRVGDIPVEYFSPQCLYILKLVIVYFRVRDLLAT